MPEPALRLPPGKGDGGQPDERLHRLPVIERLSGFEKYTGDTEDLILPDQPGGPEGSDSEPGEDLLADLLRDRPKTDVKECPRGGFWPEDKLPHAAHHVRGLEVGDLKGSGDREGQADRIPPEKFRKSLPESLARDRPDAELTVDLIVGEEVGARPGSELDEMVGNILVDIIHRRQVDEFHRGPGEERRVLDIASPLGDILKHDRATLLSILKRRRDRMYLVERLSLATYAGDRLFPLDVLDDGDGIGGGESREPRIREILPDKILFRALELPEKLVVRLDDRKAGIEDQDGVLRKTEEC